MSDNTTTLEDAELVAHHGGLIAVSDRTPPISSPVDANVDLEVLRSIPKQFAVQDEKSVNWLLRKIVAAREYAERVKTWADQERRRAEREETTLLYLYGRQVEQWTSSGLVKFKGRRRSIALPAGKVGFRHEPARLVVDDEGAVLRWAKANCAAAVQVTERLSRTVMKEHYEMTGEVPNEGAHIQPEQDRFFIG